MHFCLLSCQLLLSTLLMLLNVKPTLECGFPMPQPTVVCCGGGCGGGGGGYGGGGGGCCGRRKREAVQPLYKDRSVPCPQTEWREIIKQSILSSGAATENANVPTMAIQTALSSHFPGNKFLVICSTLDEKHVGEKQSESDVAGGQMPLLMHMSSAGDGYCNVMESRLWCQAVAMSG
uniref:Uncharacterized protein n=1 Tax=Globodera rostochiensis TaxID=31243 RepID=A0A914GS05_GLORO